MSSRVLFSLVVSPQIEDAVVDLLLEHKTVNGFSSYPINGHGGSLHELTPAECVSGRKRQILFNVHLRSEDMSGLIAQLNETFNGSGIHYWVSPILESGYIG